MARIEGFPVTVTIDNQFSSAEKESILASTREWNAFGQTVIGSDLFVMQFGSVSVELRNLDPHACGDAMGDRAHFYVVREQNQQHWNSIGFQENTPGATIRCYANDKFERQIMYMNPTLMAAGQFDQAFSHEFGHALGLDHSCQLGSGTSDFLSCSGLNKARSSYTSAVMYPLLRSSNILNPTVNTTNATSSTRVSSVLNSNDKVRGECIVGPT